MNYPKVSDVRDLSGLTIPGRFKSKSGGTLEVAFAMPEDLAREFFSADPKELAISTKMRLGFREYVVRSLPKGSIGGTEFHRIRQEIVFGLEGKTRWICEDLFGNRREFMLEAHTGLWQPPFLLHTYEVLEDNSGIAVIANTLFDPNDQKTFDTYSRELFLDLQREAAGA